MDRRDSTLTTLVAAAAALAAVLASSAANADTPTLLPGIVNPGMPPAQSAAMGPGASDKFIPTPTVSYLGWMQGPSITAPGSPYQPTTGGLDDPTNPAGVMNYVTAGYKLTPDITVSGVAEWFYTPYKGGDYTWADPFIKFKDTAIWKNSEWTFGSDARIYVPASQTSQEMGLIMQFRVSPSLSYSPAGTPWTFGLYGYAWTYMYGQYASSAPGSSSTPHYFDLYLQPNVSYQLLPTLALTGIYEAYGHQEVEGTPPFVNTSDPTDFQLGVSWDVTKWLNFSPYVQSYPGSFSWSSTSFGAYLAATVF